MRNVSLPAALCNRAEQKFGKRFSSVEELLEYVLTQVVGGDASHQDEAEQRMIEQRLRDLGYL